MYLTDAAWWFVTRNVNSASARAMFSDPALVEA
jgi:hypothetical protein